MTFPWHYFRQCVSKHAVKLTLHWFSKQLSRISMARSSKCLKGNFWAHFCLCPQPNPQIKKKRKWIVQILKVLYFPTSEESPMGGPCVFSFLSKGAHSVWDRRGKPSQIFSSPPMAPMVKSFRAFLFFPPVWLGPHLWGRPNHRIPPPIPLLDCFKEVSAVILPEYCPSRKLSVLLLPEYCPSSKLSVLLSPEDCPSRKPLV